jgi:hypothetical protein
MTAEARRINLSDGRYKCPPGSMRPARREMRLRHKPACIASQPGLETARTGRVSPLGHEAGGLSTRNSSAP